CWFAVRCLDLTIDKIPTFIEPSKENSEQAKLEAEKKETQSKLEAALAELEKVKANYQAIEVSASSKEKGQKVADALKYDEATTRKRIIDVALAEAGWDIEKTQDVTLEQEVQHQPTTSSIGYIDYVLWDDNGKPLAVIEAKKTSVSEQQGKKQAELYADGLEKTHGQRPLIFYTNGYNIWMWDDAQGYPPRKLFGFYSPGEPIHASHCPSASRDRNDRGSRPCLCAERRAGSERNAARRRPRSHHDAARLPRRGKL
ncbi:MAG: type I restriction endonuclease, partial [Pseudohongiellaceae bacterium]